MRKWSGLACGQNKGDQKLTHSLWKQLAGRVGDQIRR